MKICGLILIMVIVLGIAGFWERKTFAFLAVITAACFALAAANELYGGAGSVSRIEKSNAGDGSVEKEFTAKTEDGREIEVSLTIPEKDYTKEEAAEILNNELRRLNGLILGKNSSFGHICYDMELPETGADQNVSIAWKSSDPLVISSDGKIQSGIPEDGSEVNLTAVLTLSQEQREYEKTIRVYPPEDIKTLADEIKNEAEKENAENPGDEFILPESINGRQLTWYEKPDNNIVLVSVLLFIAGVLIRVNKTQKASEKEKKREDQLKNEYPEFISRLLLMLYSGTGVRTAFLRMAYLYNQEKKEKNARSEIFEEVTAACREMENGCIEDEAYERMAERCKAPCYRRLSVLLIQNRKRGGKGFTDELEQEVMASFAEKKRNAEAAGSAASIKLLIPLGLMLMVVLALMMIPAFMSM